MKKDFPQEIAQKEDIDELLNEKSDFIITSLQKEIKKISHDVVRMEKQYRELNRIFLQLADSEKRLSLVENKFLVSTEKMIEPMETLTGFFQIMKNHGSALTKTEIKMFAERMDISVKNMIITLENIIHWCKINNNEIIFNPKDINLNQLVIENLKFFQSISDKKNITISSAVSKKLFAYADCDLVNYLIRNLISNSIKFVPKGGMITIQGKIKKGFIEIIIKDNGIGISEQKIKSIFNPSDDIPQNANLKDTGLGLLTCKEVIELHNGKIKIASKKHKGTSVIFTLPVSKDPHLQKK